MGKSKISSMNDHELSQVNAQRPALYVTTESVLVLDLTAGKI